MVINDIGLAMFKPKLTFGSKYSIFMTQQAFVFVDAMVCREGGLTIAQVEALEPDFSLFLLKGSKNPSDAVTYLKGNILNFPNKSKK